MNKKKIMKWVILVAIIIIPVMYSFFYLKAFWDPYGNLKDMKIAIINLDKGNEDENLGNDLVESLKEKDVMQIEVLTDSDEGQKGLVNQEYYATITIPKDFTETLNNAENSDRQMTTISYSPNQKSNYLASQIINKVTTTVESELKGQVSQKVVSSVSDKLREVPEKMEDISDGAVQIQDGSSELSKGLKTLNNGTSELNSSYSEFDTGVDSAYNGSKQLTQGLEKLDAGASKIQEGTNKLADNTKDLSSVATKVNELSGNVSNLKTGVDAYVDGVNSAIAGISNTKSQLTTLASSLKAYMTANPEAMNDSNFQQAMQTLQSLSGSSSGSEGLSTLATKGTELKQGVSKLNTGVQSFASQAVSLQELSSGIQTLNNGVLELKQGLSSAKSGSTELTTGLSSLSKNSKKVKSGIGELNTGSKSALEGSKTLSDGVTTFKTEIDNGTDNTKQELTKLDGLDEYVKDPVEIEETDYAKVNSYGVGFAPYFMSISLWVGGLIALVMLYNDPEDKFKLLGKDAKNKYLRTALYMGIATLQGIVLGFILKAGLGFTVTSLGLYYVTCILVSMVFTSIILFLIENFGDVGKFLCILLLVLQLAASGGTFPIETVPKFFQNIYPYMPMNYTIRLIKESLIKTDSGMIMPNILILLGILVVFIGVTILLEYLKNRKQKNLETKA